MISEEAVEAAAQRLYQSDGLNLWGKEDESVRSHYSRKARSALEAAAPHMLVKAWEQGYFAGPYTNPYRSQA